MARAPTRLKALFYQRPTPKGIADTLAAFGCLSTNARRNRGAVIKLIDTTLHRGPDDGPPMPGPSPADRLAQALAEAGYLSDRGHAWASTIVGPDWNEPLLPDANRVMARLSAWFGRHFGRYHE